MLVCDCEISCIYSQSAGEPTRTKRRVLGPRRSMLGVEVAAEKKALRRGQNYDAAGEDHDNDDGGA